MTDDSVLSLLLFSKHYNNTGAKKRPVHIISQAGRWGSWERALLWLPFYQRQTAPEPSGDSHLVRGKRASALTVPGLLEGKPEVSLARGDEVPAG